MAIELPLIIEQPDGTVHTQGTFYSYFGNVLDGHLGYDRIGKMAFFPTPRDPDWLPQNGVHFQPVEMAAGVGPLWKHYRLVADEPTLAQFVVPLRLQSDHVAENLPDIHAWPPFGIVSEKARDCLMRLDPEGSAFVPVPVESAAGKPLGPYYHWIVRNRLFFKDDRPAAGVPRATLPFPGVITDVRIAHELLNNTVLRAWLATIPVWGLGVNMIQFVFNAPTFSALRAARLTGLVENTMDYAADRQPHESIGVIP